MKKEDIKFIKIYTDGFVEPNPGRGAWAAILLYYSHAGNLMSTESIGKAYRLTTNNRMEIMGILGGLEHVKKIEVQKLLYSDSRYALGFVIGSFRKIKSNYDLRADSKRLYSPKLIKMEWVRGHNGNEYNEKADHLCSEIGRSGKELFSDEWYERNEFNRKDVTMF